MAVLNYCLELFKGLFGQFYGWFKGLFGSFYGVVWWLF